jgi:hypothetical protein
MEEGKKNVGKGSVAERRTSLRTFLVSTFLADSISARDDRAILSANGSISITLQIDKSERWKGGSKNQR